MQQRASDAPAVEPDFRPPSRLSAAVFAAKVEVLRARRGLLELGRLPPRLGRGDRAAYPAIIAQSRTPLRAGLAGPERVHENGKIHNLRLAARALDGVVVGEGQVFSFWRQLGRASRGRGYVPGRMLQQGCLVPAVGGGLCQLSNALYGLALETGCEIVERHAHSRIVPGSDAAQGRDATIAWNYVDLRFRAPRPLQIDAKLTRGELVLGFRAASGAGRRKLASVAAPAVLRAARSCGTCDEVDCFRHEPRGDASLAVVKDRTAFLLDEPWPEYAAFIAKTRADADVLGAPFAGLPFEPRRRRWDVDGFSHVGAAPLAGLARSRALRRTASRPAANRAAMLAGAERVARSLARLAGPDIDRLVVAQSYAPFLWRDGCFGGRSVSVLMTRLPIRALQAKLDAVFSRRPERATLADFRAPHWLAEAEDQALAFADEIVTPHAEIARLFAGKAIKLEWGTPPAAKVEAAGTSRRLVFPGPTVARKGAWEVREAARTLDCEVVLLGSELEGEGFWEGVRVLRPQADGRWLEGAACVVQPAIVEDQPRRLLAAMAAGVPVVATPGCGLEPQSGLVITPEDDAQALTEALSRLIG
jgi:hypothetical protein